MVFRLGRLLAESGAAAFRVRNTMKRAANALGVCDLDVVVTADAIFATVVAENQLQTRVQRVPHLGVDMNRVSRLEMLSRELTLHPQGSFREGLNWMDREIDELLAHPREYPLWITGPLLGGSCAAFCAAMAGSPQLMGATFLGTYVGHLLRLRHISKKRTMAAVVVSCSFVSALVSWSAAQSLAHLAAASSWGWSQAETAPGKAVIASVLYLIPGVPLVNSLIDLLHSDLSAGLGRGAFASLVLVCIAAGVLAFLSLTGHPFV